MTHTVSETLNLAADLIDERGWTTIDDTSDPWGEDDPESPICLEGAVFAAAGIEASGDSTDFTCPAFAAVHQYLLDGGHYGARGGVRPYWFNDTAGRTATEVIEVLRAAALVEAAREDAARESATEHAPALAEAVAAS